VSLVILSLLIVVIIVFTTTAVGLALSKCDFRNHDDRL